MKVQRQIDPKSYQSANGFIYHYQQLVKDVVIPYQYQVLNDQVEGVEKSHVVANFRNAGRMLRGEDPGDGFYGMIFQDSDAAKWLEAVASALTRFPDAQLEKEADELIELIAQAQDKDGYLDTRFTLKDRDKRWTNLCEGHELYCMGHMMEAAAAYFEATGKRTLLDVMIRNAEYLYQRFVVEGQPGYPGHPRIVFLLPVHLPDGFDPGRRGGVAQPQQIGRQIQRYRLAGFFAFQSGHHKPQKGPQQPGHFLRQAQLLHDFHQPAEKQIARHQPQAQAHGGGSPVRQSWRGRSPCWPNSTRSAMATPWRRSSSWAVMPISEGCWAAGTKTAPTRSNGRWS